MAEISLARPAQQSPELVECLRTVLESASDEPSPGRRCSMIYLAVLICFSAMLICTAGPSLRIWASVRTAERWRL
jgi:hypothetical protein